MQYELSSQGQIEPASRHSKLGIAGFVISLLGLLGDCLSFGLLLYLVENELTTGEEIEILLVVLFFGFFLLTLTGLILSLIGIFQRDRKKQFAIAGVVINLASVCALGIPVVLMLREIF